MANEEQLAILRQGVEVWNQWRKEHPRVEVDLTRGHLWQTALDDANLSGANLSRAGLWRARLVWADLTGASLRRADLNGADLQEAVLTGTNLTNADLTGARVYGISVCNAKLDKAIQKDNVITKDKEPVITVDNLEVAQFIHLLIHNDKMRHVIDTITSKVVLILGRFTEERKDVLDAMRTWLRTENYSPVMFDFEKPRDRNLTETVKTLALLSRFVIVDLTAARSVQQEMQATIPAVKVPFIPVIREGRNPWGMFEDYDDDHWVLEEHYYKDKDDLLLALEHTLIPAALEKIEEIREIRERKHRKRQERRERVKAKKP